MFLGYLFVLDLSFFRVKDELIILKFRWEIFKGIL